MKLISTTVTFLITLAIILCVASATTAQEQQKPMPTPTPTAKPLTPEAPTAPPANPADVASIDSIIASVYDVISGPAGKKRDWDRMRSLFIPGARLIPTGPRPEGAYGSRVLTVDEYIVIEPNPHQAKMAARNLDIPRVKKLTILERAFGENFASPQLREASADFVMFAHSEIWDGLGLFAIYIYLPVFVLFVINKIVGIWNPLLNIAYGWIKTVAN